jgi:hypothetical protein
MKAALTTLMLLSALILMATVLSTFNITNTYAQVTRGGGGNATTTTPQPPPSARTPSTAAASVFRYPSLVVVTHVNNTKGANIRSDNFTQVVTNTYRTSDGYAIAFHLLRGSDIGININLRPGTFAVTEPGNSTTPLNRSYNTNYSGDCTGTPSTVAGKTLGVGIIRLDESKTCVVTKTPVK